MIQEIQKVQIFQKSLQKLKTIIIRHKKGD